MTALSEVRTTCPYCGVGCGVIATAQDDVLVAVAGDPAHPANAGRLCVKGTTLADTQVARGRLLRPQVDGVAVDWDAALDAIGERFAEIIARRGPGAVAMYLSGQLLTEDYYVANKLMKGFVGSPHVDTNSRLCMSSAVVAHKRAFGEDIVPCEYADIDAADLIVLVGSNAAWAHPVIHQRIVRRRQAGARVVVIDPRRTATCEIADLHLAIKPGADAALFNGLLCHLAEHGCVDADYVAQHTSGFTQALAAAREDATQLAARTGLEAEALATFLDWFAATPAVLTLFSQGVNQASNGADKGSAIINCHLATGRIGRAGAGPFSLTGQPNAMGGREVGGLANQLAAHMDFAPRHLDRVRRFWQAPRLVAGPGLKAVDLFAAVECGDIEAIWILGTNPVVSLPRSSRVEAALARCPLVVVSDCVADTETTRLADILLPAAGWGEKDGTVTNSERVISRQRSFLPLPELARPDWWAICAVACRLGHGASFDFANPAAIFREHAALTAFENDGERLLDLGALATIDDDQWDDLTPRRWPLDGRRPFADGRFPTADGRGRLVPVEPHVPVQQPSARLPFVLNSGRLRDQWHTMTRTGAAPRLFGHVDEPQVAMAEVDALRLGLRRGDLAELSNDSGLLRAIVVPDPGIAPGQLFVPMHWNGMFSWPTRVGDLIEAVTDPDSGQPESKHGAVAVRALQPAAWVRIDARVPLSGLADQELLFRVRIPTEGGWRHEFALPATTDPDLWFSAVVAELQARELESVRHGDSETGQRRLLVMDREGASLLAFLAPERSMLPAADLITRARASASEAPWTLMSGVLEAEGDSSRIVCTCMEVREAPIRAAMGAGSRTVEALGSALGCGTRCGSCIPDLMAMIDNPRPSAGEFAATTRRVGT